ncbi:MAG TPA: trypsin-like peptidase domain-containing protein [Candidatus Cloacimonas sp.]|nr:trypsin-like peptidase domain-containing protein [Candidatus Cloacimonas sp.]MDD2250798.1 trypsin-like peptidase domain-containing protein [Candidatus Cloacimonadota bacterium]MCK9158136.1 trypsin-like peptidase domain-containing protein [Candidatus Cloacimonas sp.]MCK9164938.1 trypsin-like peptidase domain-containing protein [Candidatus Cloacimonas sp.]MDD3734600.1 trypsin-like peptidase domain-containing protein [Candidatus Cloacimonadota bacterium]
MKRINLFTVILILLLNAFITMALINKYMDKSVAIDNSYTEYSSKPSKASAANRINSITEAVKAVEPAVVSINVIKTEYVRARSPFGFGFFDFFGFAPMMRQVESIGSGVIYDPKGYIITNAHVVSGATQIKVILPDKREYEGVIAGIDEIHDVAKLKINGNNLPVARLGNSNDLIIGEWSIAVGNPYGFLMNDSKPSVSVGVISAVSRNFAARTDKREYKSMIQTDAAVNPGNSGGPLVNINGEVVGINTFIFSESGGNIGIGFALPINSVKTILAKI